MAAQNGGGEWWLLPLSVAVASSFRFDFVGWLRQPFGEAAAREALRLDLRAIKSMYGPFGASDQQKPIFRARRERAGWGTLRSNIDHTSPRPIMQPDAGQSRRDKRIRGLDIDRRFCACMRACVAGGGFSFRFSIHDPWLHFGMIVNFLSRACACVAALIDLRHRSRCS